MKRRNTLIRVVALATIFTTAIVHHAEGRFLSDMRTDPSERDSYIGGSVHLIKFMVTDEDNLAERFENKVSPEYFGDFLHAHHMGVIRTLKELDEVLKEEAQTNPSKNADLREAVDSILEADAGFDAENGYAGLGEAQKGSQYWDERLSAVVANLKASEQFGSPTNEAPPTVVASETAEAPQPADGIVVTANTVPAPTIKPATSRAAATNASTVPVATPEKPAAHSSRLAIFLTILGVGGLAALGLRIAFRKR